MRKELRLLLLSTVLLVGLVSLLAVPLGEAYAGEFKGGENVVIEEDESYTKDLYLKADKEVEVNGKIYGDLVAVAEEVNIGKDATITGNAILLAGKVNMAGEIHEDLIVIAGEFVMPGMVLRNAFVGVGQASISGNVGDDMLIGAGTVNYTGFTAGDLRVGSGQFVMDGDVAEDLYARCGTLNIVDETRVSGDVNVRSGEESPASNVGISMPTLKILENMPGAGIFAGASAIGLLVKFLYWVGLVVVGFLFLRLMPVKSLKVIENMSASVNKGLASLAVGFLMVLLVPVLVLVLAFTVVGWPLAILLVGLLIFVGIFGSVFAGISIGKMILDAVNVEDESFLRSLFLGTLVLFVALTVIGFIPCLGSLAKIAVFMWALGAFAMMKWQDLKEAKGVLKGVAKGAARKGKGRKK